MNRRLSDLHIRSTCRELLHRDARLTGRGLRRELERRYGARGKTERIFRIWREETRAAVAVPLPSAPPDITNMQQRLQHAEAAAAQSLARAERAELRERAHQERWAAEIDRLRLAAQAHTRHAEECRALQTRVLQLTRELHSLRYRIRLD